MQITFLESLLDFLMKYLIPPIEGYRISQRVTVSLNQASTISEVKGSKQNNSRLHAASVKFNQFSWNSVHATSTQEHFIDAVAAFPDPWQLPGSYTSHWISWNKGKSTSCTTFMQEMRFYWITLANLWQYYHHLETLSNPKSWKTEILKQALFSTLLWQTH